MRTEKAICIAMVRMGRHHHVFVIRETATVPDVHRWKKRDRRLIRLITDEEGQSKRGRSRKRLQAAGCVVRDEEDDTVADESDEESAYFSSSHPNELELASAARRRDTSSRKEQREQISVALV